MIVFDTETTGKLLPNLVPLDQQPEIIEWGAVKLDDLTLEELAHQSFLIRPRLVKQLPAITTKITGITDADLKGKTPFPGVLPDLTTFFLGERILTAHNVEFDCEMLAIELRRLGREYKFPWPPQRLDTIDLTKHNFDKFPTLDAMYEFYCKRPRPNASHRALNDARDLAECVRVLYKEGGRP